MDTGKVGMVGGEARSLMLYEANKKSLGVAYVLWFFLGGVGGHRFYSGRTGSAVAQLLLTVAGVILAAAGVGLVLLAIVGIWVLVDAFLIPGWIAGHNNLLAHQLAS
ncbi:TM2 domain-containing protein [Ancylobacter mangrovi]|uniref:TM2 domain-containing protein n=1 Tax=Ancylobacter mangrovi TaxID=2972472 RepID=A0A9X2T5Y2_9HYPH|nr:TM2 domain-containing protein [Ancylobacter mangrovi]MCS0495864.1 TM2 domain-containing protein [Ancylobacter mangrovi]MCS0502696.1 TM2 domain-containing protein [Ancylobacter mangrovi]